MRITLQPELDIEALKKFLYEFDSDIQELHVIPQNRVGRSNTKLYIYYYKTEEVDTFTKTLFF